MYGISDFISLTEWFSATNTSTLVTGPGRMGARAVFDVGAVVCDVAPAVFGRAPEDAGTDGDLLAVEQPDAANASTQATAAPWTIRAISMPPVKRMGDQRPYCRAQAG